MSTNCSICDSIITEDDDINICEVCGKFDETVVTSGKGWIRSTCSCCIEDKTTYNKALDKKMIDLWKKVREDESKKTSEI